jgi:hypothetical protein
MSNFKVLIGFSEYSDEGVLSRGRVVEGKMKGNANFPSPAPSIAELTAALNKFEGDLTLSNGGRGGVEATATKNASREALTIIMQNLGLDVQKTGNDDYVVLISSGYDIKGTPAPGTQPDAPKNLTLSDGAHKGECNVKHDRVVNATMYEVRYSAEPHLATSWNTLTATTRTRSTIFDIAHGTEIYVQVRSINSHGASEWSNKVDLLVR